MNALLPLLLAANALRAAAPPEPKIINAGPRQTEDGPPLAKGDKFRPGETVFYSFEVSGYQHSPLQKIRLSYRVEAFDPRGVRLVEPIESIFDATLHEEDKQWMPKLRVQLILPPVVPSGVYKMTTVVTDDISHLSATAEGSFEVEGHTVPLTSELTIRNFTFHRSEEEVASLATAAYRAGDTVFARFDIAGFRYGPENGINVYYDVAVLNPAGKQIYAQEHAAEERSSSFYPKPYVPGQISLNLQANMRPGAYTVVVSAHDETGRQIHQTRQMFTVE